MGTASTKPTNGPAAPTVSIWRRLMLRPFMTITAPMVPRGVRAWGQSRAAKPAPCSTGPQIVAQFVAGEDGHQAQGKGPAQPEMREEPDFGSCSRHLIGPGGPDKEGGQHRQNIEDDIHPGARSRRWGTTPGTASKTSRSDSESSRSSAVYPTLGGARQSADRPGEIERSGTRPGGHVRLSRNAKGHILD